MPTDGSNSADECHGDGERHIPVQQVRADVAQTATGTHPQKEDSQLETRFVHGNQACDAVTQL
ncbi:hypothetical protein DPMN_177809 [Dreissena polymorpha]|uniref:Uncharacterized protein n=1 Tax=Dreissena polymorpha TaxID=45954 RepID=A0A9D4EDQ2_DREPO|nr:hypothetical protein DPMN_177809 [Dreissena polymorpha]